MQGKGGKRNSPKFNSRRRLNHDGTISVTRESMDGRQKEEEGKRSNASGGQKTLLLGIRNADVKSWKGHW